MRVLAIVFLTVFSISRVSAQAITANAGKNSDSNPDLNKPALPIQVRCPAVDEQRYIMSQGQDTTATSQYIKYSEGSFKVLVVTRAKGEYIKGDPVRDIDKDLILAIIKNKDLHAREVYMNPLGLSIVFTPITGKTLPDPIITLKIIQDRVPQYTIVPLIFPECSIPYLAPAPLKPTVKPSVSITSSSPPNKP